MKEQSRLSTSALQRAVRFAAASLAIAGLGAVSGCLTRPIEPIVPNTTSVVTERLTQSGVNKIDLLLVVDNSASMADKQAILALAIPDLIVGLVNPQCLDNSTNAPLPASQQPSGPLTACPANSTREFTPVNDIHIGLISSSLGTFGANGCPDPGPNPACVAGATDNDKGHLVTRADPCGMSTVTTYQNLGFLQWDPGGVLKPPGETAIGDPTATPPVPGLTTSLHDLVVGDGQLGCGFESQNEAWYRFLIDPTPYDTIALGANNQVQISGTDKTLLQERSDFLRPDSLLAIVNVTDETDTSIKEFSSYPLFAEPSLHLPHARTECTTKGPTDMCCFSCGQTPPTGCGPNSADANCKTSYTNADENQALRAFGLISHKQRYGIEFFYQPSRYVTALTSATVADVNGKMVPNPIYSVLNPSADSSTVRDPGLVFYAAIVGVPWQLIARQNKGTPDLIAGVSTIDPTQVGGFKTSAELDLLDSAGNSFWDDIAGDPENYVPAKSPYMVESTVPRSGKDPITQAVLSPPTTADGMGAMVGGSLINDHERTIITPADDIEYACVFPILAPIDCSTGATCDCPSSAGTTTDNPLCDPTNPTSQVKAKAYPGIKHLAIARGLGTQGIAASICAKQLTDNTAADYGYRPAVKAIIDRLKLALHGQCLPRTLTPDATGEVQCLILEASVSSNCVCDPTKGRQPVTAAHQPAVAAAEQDPLDATAKWNCFCEIPQTAGPISDSTSPLSNCATATSSTANGWCYVDPSTAPSADVMAETALVAKCPQTEQHDIRFVGNGAPNSGATLFITCAGQ